MLIVGGENMNNRVIELINNRKMFGFEDKWNMSYSDGDVYKDGYLDGGGYPDGYLDGERYSDGYSDN